MKYFTRDLYERTQSDDESVLDAADADWELALERYERHLQVIWPELPGHLREIQELRLHDAIVQSIGRQANQLFLILRKDIPPRNLIILAYELDGEPVIEPFARNPRGWANPTAFNFDEFDVIHEGNSTVFTQEIVFGNGWLLHLRFRNVAFTRAAPVFPVANGTAGLNLCPGESLALPT